MGLLRKQRRNLQWKAQYLSLGGRLTLINTVLDSLPTYVKSLVPISTKVAKKLDKLRRDFLWLGNKEGKGYHPVNWKTVQLGMAKGAGRGDGANPRKPAKTLTCNA